MEPRREARKDAEGTTENMESYAPQRLPRFVLYFGVAAALLIAACSTPQTAKQGPSQEPPRQTDPAAEEAAPRDDTTAAFGAGPGSRPEAPPPGAPTAGRNRLRQPGKQVRGGEEREPPRSRAAAVRPRRREARFSASRKPGFARGQGRPGVAERGRNGARGKPRGSAQAPRADRRAPLARIPFEDYLELAPHLEGVASWYGPGFQRKKTANGEIYNQYGLTAAHRVLPMGTRVLVENIETGAKVRVRINDRGPYKKGRIIDLSRSAAIRVGMIEKGTAPVRLTILRWPAGMDPALGLKAYRQFVVQVAAYPSASKAERQRLDLGARFNEVSFQVDRTAKGLFAIFAGPYDEESTARRVASRLQKSGVTNLVRSYRK